MKAIASANKFTQIVDDLGIMETLPGALISALPFDGVPWLYNNEQKLLWSPGDGVLFKVEDLSAAGVVAVLYDEDMLVNAEMFTRFSEGTLGKFSGRRIMNAAFMLMLGKLITE